MKLNPAYVNEKLIHVLLFSNNNLVIEDWESLDELTNLFSIIQGFQIEHLDLRGYDDIESLEQVIENLCGLQRKLFVFQHMRTEFLPKILPAKRYRYVILLNSDLDVRKQVLEYMGSNILTYSVETREFQPECTIPEHFIEYSNFIIEIAKKRGIKSARFQVFKLFEFVEEFHSLYMNKSKEVVQKYLLKLGKKLHITIPQIEQLCLILYGRDRKTIGGPHENQG